MKMMSEKFYWSVGYDGATNRLDDIVRFLKSEQPFNTSWSPEYFRSRLIGDDMSLNGYLYYAEANNEIIGVASLTKKTGFLDGRKCTVAEVGNTFVSKRAQRHGVPVDIYKPELSDRDYVNKSIFGRLINELLDAARRDGVLLVYGTPNSHSLPGYTKRLEFVEVEAYDNHTYYRPRVDGIVAQLTYLAPLRRIFRLCERVFDSLHYLITVRLFGLHATFATNVESIADDAGKLWKEKFEELGFGLERDRRYWQQRYSAETNEGYLFLTLKDRKGGLASLIVLRVLKTSDTRSGLAIVEWVGNRTITIATVVSAAVYAMGKTASVTHVYIWASNTSFVNKLRLSCCLFLLKKRAPIIFRNLSSTEFCMSDRFEFHLGSSDAA